MTESVAAVVVFHDSGDSILACVESLLAQTRMPRSVVVVANSAVPERTDARLRALGASVMPMRENLGFGAACNVAAKEVDEQYLWFVNPDVRCRPTCLEGLLAVAGPRVVVAPAIRKAGGGLERSVKSDSYLSPSVLVARELFVGRWLHLGSPSLPREVAAVDVVSGACVLVPRALFAAVGGFDERYFLYGEDVDLCLRLRREGAAVKYVPDAVAVHASGTGAGGTSPGPEVLAIKGREARRSHALLLERYAGRSAVFRYQRGLAAVLPLKIAAQRLAGRTSGAAKDMAALRWSAEPRGRT